MSFPLRPPDGYRAAGIGTVGISQNTGPVQVVLSLSSRDEGLAKEIAKHFSPLVAAGKIELWFDGMTWEGGNHMENVKRRFAKADIVIPLISADYMAEDGLSKMAKEAEERGAKLIPVYARPCAWKYAFPGKSVLFTDQAIASSGNKSGALKELTELIRKTASELRSSDAPLQEPKPAELPDHFVKTSGPVQISIIVGDDPRDKEINKALVEQLKGLTDHAKIAKVWHAGLIRAGAITSDEIRNNLNNAHVIVAIVSESSLSDRDIRNQIATAVKRAETDGIAVRMVILRDCAWEADPLVSRLGNFRLNDKSVATSSNRDGALSGVADRIDVLVRTIKVEGVPSGIASDDDTFVQVAPRDTTSQAIAHTTGSLWKIKR